MVHSQEMLKCFRLYAGQVLAHNISLDIDKLSLWRLRGWAHHKSNSQVCPVCKKFSGYRRCHCMNPLRCNPNVQWDVFTSTKPDIIESWALETWTTISRSKTFSASLETGAILYLVQENNLRISFFSKLLCRVKEPKETSKGWKLTENVIIISDRKDLESDKMEVKT